MRCPSGLLRQHFRRQRGVAHHDGVANHGVNQAAVRTQQHAPCVDIAAHARQGGWVAIFCPIHRRCGVLLRQRGKGREGISGYIVDNVIKIIVLSQRIGVGKQLGGLLHARAIGGQILAYGGKAA